MTSLTADKLKRALVEVSTIPVLDKGFVRLDAVLASDLRVANAARVSLNQRHEEMEEGDHKLVRSLLRNHHGTPFEHNYFCFHVKAPLFVFREWHRHRTGWSYNEWSARYSQLEPDFYVPANEDVRKQVGTSMSYKYEPVGDLHAETFQHHLLEASHESYADYLGCIEAGYAKEIARLFLPVNIYSEMYASCNARSLMHFLGLRNAPTAQKEIRLYAEALEQMFADHMPTTYAAFLEFERVAP